MNLAEHRGEDATAHDNLVREMEQLRERIVLLDRERVRREARVELWDELIAAEAVEPPASEPTENGHPPPSLRARVAQALRS